MNTSGGLRNLCLGLPSTNSETPGVWGRAAGNYGGIPEFVGWRLGEWTKQEAARDNRTLRREAADLAKANLHK